MLSIEIEGRLWQIEDLDPKERVVFSVTIIYVTHTMFSHLLSSLQDEQL